MKYTAVTERLNNNNYVWKLYQGEEVDNKFEVEIIITKKVDPRILRTWRNQKRKIESNPQLNKLEEVIIL